MPTPSDTFENGGYRLVGLRRINLLVGRNGAGKSRLLRGLSNPQHQNSDRFFISHISPERGGSLTVEAGVENTVRRNPDHYENQRRLGNHVSEFKRLSASRLRELAIKFALRVETDRSLRLDLAKTFESERLEKINEMLLNVTIKRDDAQEFYFQNKEGSRIEPETLSSGESEAICLAVESMHFFGRCTSGKENYLFLDEPDVHLHPDLQGRLARLLKRELDSLRSDIAEVTRICVVTHSTPLICAFASMPDCRIGTVKPSSAEVVLEPISRQFSQIAPLWGHPLSQVISNDLPLILEGDDDERVFQQAVRSSQGLLRFFPVIANSVDQQTDLEILCDRLLSIFDSPVALSIRDADGSPGILDPIGCVRRFRLQCYAIENALLTDDVLSIQKTNWPMFCQQILSWCGEHPSHRDRPQLEVLAASSDRMRHSKIKDIRTLIPIIMGSTKPWEVIIGQAVAKLPLSADSGEFSLTQFIGRDLLVALGVLPNRIKSSPS